MDSPLTLEAAKARIAQLEEENERIAKENAVEKKKRMRELRS